MEWTIILLCCGSLLFLFIIITVFSTFRVVNEHNRLVIYRLGRLIGIRGPGLVLIIPFTDKSKTVDLRESSKHLENIPAGTIDGTSLVVDLSWTFRIIDPIKSTLGYQDYKVSIENKIMAELRELISKLTFIELYKNRGKLIIDLRNNVQSIVDNWGIEIIGIDIKDIRKRDLDMIK